MSRRSQRLSDVIRRKNDAVECITITDSEEDDAPLPRPQPRRDSSSSDIEYLSAPDSVINLKPRKKRRGRPPGSRNRQRSDSQPIFRSSSTQPEESPRSGKRIYNSQPVGGYTYRKDVESQPKNDSSSGSNYSASDEGNEEDGGTSSSSSTIEIRRPRRVHVPIDDASTSSSPAQLENENAQEQISSPLDSDEPMDCDEPAKSNVEESVPVPPPLTNPPRPRHLPNKENKESRVEFLDRARARRLALDRILGCIKLDEGPQFIVKWRGLEQIERIPLEHLRVIAPQQVLEYMIARIRWMTSDE